MGRAIRGSNANEKRPSHAPWRFEENNTFWLYCPKRIHASHPRLFPIRSFDVLFYLYTRAFYTFPVCRIWTLFHAAFIAGNCLTVELAGNERGEIAFCVAFNFSVVFRCIFFFLLVYIFPRSHPVVPVRYFLIRKYFRVSKLNSALRKPLLRY